MLLTPLKILTTLFVIYVLRVIYKKFRSGQLGRLDFIFWFTFWLLVEFVALFPQQGDFLAEVLGVGNGVDVLVFLSVVLLFYLIFRLYVKMENMEKAITEIVRKLALSKEKKEDQDST